MPLFRCFLCDYEGKDRKYLKTHIRRKDENTEYLCKQCDFITTASIYLSKHTKEYPLNNPYFCQYCGYEARRCEHLEPNIKFTCADQRSLKLHTRNNHI